MSYTIGTLDAALTLVETIAEHPGLGVSELARRVGGSKSQVFRLLYTLETRGYVNKDHTSRTFSLGYRALYLGERAKRQTDLIRVAQPYLDELAEKSRENVHLIIRDGVRSVCVGLCESPQNLRLYAQLGRRGPLHAGGGSKVLLAFAPPEVREAVTARPLERFTSDTITDPERLTAVLEAIRRDGYHVALGDIDEGAFSVAAPIRDHANVVIAALSIAGPMSRLDEAALERHRDDVLDYVGRISAALRGVTEYILASSGRGDHLHGPRVGHAAVAKP
jgi:IclR family transcriptional regulator, KDG regulon repressor